jgi:hypothetical protein
VELILFLPTETPRPKEIYAALTIPGFNSGHC